MNMSAFVDTDYLGLQSGCPVFIDYLDNDDENCTCTMLTKVDSDGGLTHVFNYANHITGEFKKCRWVVV